MEDLALFRVNLQTRAFKQINTYVTAENTALYKAVFYDSLFLRIQTSRAIYFKATSSTYWQVRRYLSSIAIHILLSVVPLHFFNLRLEVPE